MPRSVLLIPLALVLLLAAACDDEPLEVTVTAELASGDAPVSVEATAVSQNEDGTFSHGVRVTWNGDEPVRLDDARFAHYYDANGATFILAGRGCSPWEPEDGGTPGVVCTDDLQVITLQPGDTHEYPVALYPDAGPRGLARGTYLIDETIDWWPGDDLEALGADPGGSFTIRLTYEVR
jgi:hypothetical protein